MEKKIRVYYSTFVDVYLNSDDFPSYDAMIDYAEDNVDSLGSDKDFYKNLSKDLGGSEIID